MLRSPQHPGELGSTLGSAITDVGKVVSHIIPVSSLSRFFFWTRVGCCLLSQRGPLPLQAAQCSRCQHGPGATQLPGVRQGQAEVPWEPSRLLWSPHSSPKSLPLSVTRANWC